MTKKNGKLEPKKIAEPFGEVEINNDDIYYALIVRRSFSDALDLTDIVLQVNSPHILKAFRDVIKSYTTVPFDFTNPFELSSPFQMLYHYWDELLEYRTATDDNQIRQHLGLLFDFMNHEIGADREKIQMMIRMGQITYLNAWVIFRPGDLLYTTVMDQPWLLRCQKTAYEESTRIGPYIDVYCSYIDHDGSQEGEADQVIRIVQKRKFGSENPAFIRDLPIYPRRFVKEENGEEGLDARLQERGRKFLALKGMSVQAYDGLAQFLKEPPYTYFNPEMEDWDAVWSSFTVSL